MMCFISGGWLVLAVVRYSFLPEQKTEWPIRWLLSDNNHTITQSRNPEMKKRSTPEKMLRLR